MPINANFVGGGRSVVQDLFVETGFCRGITCALAHAAGFREIRSIEIDGDRYREGLVTARRIRRDGKVQVVRGTSPDALAHVLDRNRATTVYLDAHYSGIPGEVIDSKYGECPLLAELQTIFARPWRANPIVVIDDAHMLRRPWDADLSTRFTESHWPTADQVLRYLPGYDTVEENRTLYCFPADAATPVHRKPVPSGPVFTAVVPQGIGDIVWVYQKLAPLCAGIRFRVTEFGGDRPDVERRALATIAALPKVVGVETVRVQIYPPALEERRRLTDLLPDLATGAGVYFAANPWLEAGAPLESIDPDLPVAWDLGVTPVRPVGLPERYVVLYVSGDAARHATLCEKVWPVAAWVRLVECLAAAGKIDPAAEVVVIGAGFDAPVTLELTERVRGLGFAARAVYDLDLARLLGLFAGADLFLGYQSGLNVLAGSVGANQFMMYFPRIAPMGCAWVRPEHRTDGRFRYGSFDATPEAIARTVQPGRRPG
jgi:hypothetical protein